MSNFGWSYPAGCTGTPYDEDEDPVECPTCGKENWDEEADAPVYPPSPDYCSEACVPAGDIDYGGRDEGYQGDGEDGCLIRVGRGENGKWYTTIVVDCNGPNSSQFTEDLETDAGPFDSRKEASDYGNSQAIDWCLFNHVAYDTKDD